MNIVYIFNGRGIILVAALSVGFFLTIPAYAENYTALDLTDPSRQPGIGSSTLAYGINASGEVVGISQSDARHDGTEYSFITGPNGMDEICSFCSPGALEGSGTYIHAINDNGKVVGQSGYRPFISDPNGMVFTQFYFPDAEFAPGAANSINASGQAVGGTNINISGDLIHHAFITGPNGVNITDIGILGGTNSEATGINASGQVVGWSDTSDGKHHAFITGPAGNGMTDLGTLGGVESFAAVINAGGEVVGWSDTIDGKHHAFITGINSMGMADLGTLGGIESFATAINASGQVVGGSDTRAFITGPNGVDMTNLNALVTLPGPYQSLSLSDARGDK
jgi:probable HAF family extracellular repeat protein